VTSGHVEPIYCIDSDVLIELGLRYPRDIFEPIWSVIEGLIEAGRLIAPDEVFAELDRRTDAIARWARDHRAMFRFPDSDITDVVARIMAEFPNLGEVATRTTTIAADPWIVALAVTERERQMRTLFARPVIVVTNERQPRRTDTRQKPRIPLVCAHFGVESIGFFDFLRREGIRLSTT
jgi:hypothetical protein